MNDHPEELLADYADGTLGADERARVDAHLRTCDRCREELTLSAGARLALSALPELEAPPGIPLAVRRRSPRRPPSRTWRVVGTAAAGIILAAGIVFGITQLGGVTSDTQSAGGGGQAGTDLTEAPAPEAQEDEERTLEAQGAPAAEGATSDFAPPPLLPTYLESDRDYDASSLAPLARTLRAEARDAVARGIEKTATDFYREFEPSAFTPEVRQAIRCVLAEVPPEQAVVPFRIEVASFEGTPAYVAAFLQGPTPEDPYDRLVIWVVDRAACSLLSLASQTL